MPLDFIVVYIMEDATGNRYLKRLPQIRLNFIDGYISSYCSVINSPKRLEEVKQSNKMASIMCDLESDCMREREEENKRGMEADENRSRKSEEKQVRGKKDRLRVLDRCEYLVCSVLTFGMNNINYLKLKELRVILRYYFGSEMLKVRLNKVGLVEAVTDLFQKY